MLPILCLVTINIEYMTLVSAPTKKFNLKSFGYLRIVYSIDMHETFVTNISYTDIRGVRHVKSSSYGCRSY